MHSFTHITQRLQSKQDSAAQSTYLWGEIPQHQPAAGPVGAVGTPGGSLCNTNVKYHVSVKRKITVIRLQINVT